MALIKCKECGSEVSSLAQTCPKCGIAHPGGAGQLVVHRAHGITGAKSSVEIRIDGQPIGVVKNGGTASFDLLAGNYRLDVSGGGMSNSAVAQVHDGIATTFEVSFSSLGALGGGLKLRPL
jgi:hypothetical protein